MYMAHRVQRIQGKVPREPWAPFEKHLPGSLGGSWRI